MVCLNLFTRQCRLQYVDGGAHRTNLTNIAATPQSKSETQLTMGSCLLKQSTIRLTLLGPPPWTGITHHRLFGKIGKPNDINGVALFLRSIQRRRSVPTKLFAPLRTLRKLLRNDQPKPLGLLNEKGSAVDASLEEALRRLSSAGSAKEQMQVYSQQLYLSQVNRVRNLSRAQQRKQPPCRLLVSHLRC